MESNHTNPYTSDSILAAITRPAALTPEHAILARLIGDWDIDGNWHILPGDQPTAIQGYMENREILGGLFVESRGFYGDAENSLTIYGFNPQENQFLAFAINRSTALPELDYGQYNAETSSLCFASTEYMGAERSPIRVARTLTFPSTDRFNIDITYPDFEPARQLGMAARMSRSSGIPA